ncbi:SURF1 family protein [Sphingomonas sp. ST-64]|uniref:SURF1-like protein n=1 Tax=Sphingomonas plantiphila TaxID=3163295 RepID=A0ABW8YQA5_9SPHN
MTRGRAVLAALLLVCALGFVALGVWQVERRAWKHALIDAVTSRSTAGPVAAPGPSVEPQPYRRVHVTGRFLHDRETLVRAVSNLGSGYWVVTPLDNGGFTVLVNRGFVPPERRDPATRAAANGAGEARVTGLIRLTEPGGGFLRSNDPASGNWYSRDVAAIAAARGVTDAVPYFIDADAAPNPGGWPRGGLTVLRFSDNHAVYALTWFALALMSLAGIWLVLRKRTDRPK